ncbi:glycosyltransferase family 39 protein, partial [Candidatus Bipolaricaulota bacterium]|nr:glycosyltransferase family 39 protein [Candidatus Bipolaricaulota bacterium]
MRLATEGLGILSKNPTSLLGLKPYAYPPFYHILGFFLYKIFNSQLVFFLLPPFLGMLSVLVFYKIAWEIFEKKREAILSAFLFSMVPSFVARTSVFIPESLGILLFTIILYLLIKYAKSMPGYSDIDNFSLGGFFKIFKG